MLVKAPDPEQPAPLQHIWRKLYCLNYMQSSPDYWGKTEQQHIDSGYCLDRYSFIDAPRSE
jgi:hypothetical protein